MREQVEDTAGFDQLDEVIRIVPDLWRLDLSDPDGRRLDLLEVGVTHGLLGVGRASVRDKISKLLSWWLFFDEEDWLFNVFSVGPLDDEPKHILGARDVTRTVGYFDLLDRLHRGAA